MTDEIHKAPELDWIPPDEKAMGQIYLAWIVGVLSGGGSIRASDEIIITTSDHGFLKTFDAMFKLLLKRSTHPIKERQPPGQNTCYRWNITDHKLAQLVGYPTKTTWPENLRNRHGWILDSSPFSAAFLGGYFDINGSILNEALSFSVSNEESYYTLQRLLSNVGVSNVHPFFIYGKLRSLQVFEKEEKIKILDQLLSFSSLLPYKKKSIQELKDAIQEKKDIRNILLFELLTYYFVQKNMTIDQVSARVRNMGFMFSKQHLLGLIGGEFAQYGTHFSSEIIAQVIEKLVEKIIKSQYSHLEPEYIEFVQEMSKKFANEITPGIMVIKVMAILQGIFALRAYDAHLAATPNSSFLIELTTTREDMISAPDCNTFSLHAQKLKTQLSCKVLFDLRKNRRSKLYKREKR